MQTWRQARVAKPLACTSLYFVTVSTLKNCTDCLEQLKLNVMAVTSFLKFRGCNLMLRASFGSYLKHEIVPLVCFLENNKVDQYSLAAVKP